MIGLGTIVNAAAIIAGGTIGSFAKDGLPGRYKDTILQGIGLSVVVIGFAGTLQGIFKVVGGSKLDQEFIMLMIFSLVIGGLIGEAMNIEHRLDRFGAWVQSKLSRSSGSFGEGFVTASLVYCVGAMAIVGSLEDGLSGNFTTLFAKSILDGISAIVFASTMGIGVAFSAIPVLIYQGSITLLARFIQPYLTPEVITQMSMVGSILIAGIGFNILEMKRFKVGNLLPAILIPLVYSLILGMFR